MQLKSIHLKHTGPFQDLNVEFDYAHKPITLILGEQGVGKTTLLKHIFQALSWFPARFKDSRTAGIVTLDQDISFKKNQSKTAISVHFPAELGVLSEASDVSNQDQTSCSWRLYKTLTASGTGFSQVETQQLEQMVELYQHAIKQDPLQSLPVIAYYPADRFINEINLLSKNIPAVFQPSAAYDISTLPFTTFARFFEWLREVSDIENAQAAQLLQQLAQQNAIDNEQDVQQLLFHAQAQLKTPHLQALKNSLQHIFPDLTDFYLEYHPKLQLMVCYQDQIIPYQQLSNSLKIWIALIGDLVRRLCLLNPLSLYPCLEGEGIILIDQIDTQLDQMLSREILIRLNQAFPQVQIIATGNRDELLEHATAYQCYKLSHQGIAPIELGQPTELYDQIYSHLFDETSSDTALISDLNTFTTEMFDQFLAQIEHLTEDQKAAIIRAIRPDSATEQDASDHAR